MSDRFKGEYLILGREDGESYWQPQPAHGHVTIKVSPHNSRSNSFATGFQVIDPGGHIRPHSHARAEETLFVFEGTGKAVIEGKEYQVGPGALVYVGRHVRHSIVNTGTMPMTVLWTILPPGLEDALAAIGRPRGAGEKAPAAFGRPEDVNQIYERAYFDPE
jgi:mannose-6-phosphate isomerase-like protein (cupin superfamily)